MLRYKTEIKTETQTFGVNWRSVQRGTMGEEQTGKARVQIEGEDDQKEAQETVQKHDGRQTRSRQGNLAAEKEEKVT